jgi:hypothetical protein
MTALSSTLTSLSRTSLFVLNQGAEVTGTNFWETELSKSGLFHASFNAGACRLLLPEGLPRRAGWELLNAAASAREVLISVIGRRPASPQVGRPLALELLWEDDSNSPFTMHLSEGQICWGVNDLRHGRAMPVSIWRRGADGRPEKASDLPGRLRLVSRLPYLKPWGK